MYVLSAKIMNTLTVVLANTMDEETFKEKIESFFQNTIIAWLLWAASMFFIILLVSSGFKVATAKSPEEKDAAKKGILAKAIGLAIVLSASVIVTVYQSVIQGIWS